MCGCSFMYTARCASVSTRCILPSGWTSVVIFFNHSEHAEKGALQIKLSLILYFSIDLFTLCVRFTE